MKEFVFEFARARPVWIGPKEKLTSQDLCRAYWTSYQRHKRLNPRHSPSGSAFLDA